MATELERERQRRLELFIGNTLYDLAKIIWSINSPIQQQQLATKTTDKQFMKAKIPAKY